MSKLSFAWVSSTVVGFLFFTAPFAWANAERSIWVSGDCVRSVSRDRAQVSLLIEKLDSLPGPATQKAAEILQKVQTQIKDLKLKDQVLETTEVSVQEDFDWQQNTRKSKGFKARTVLRVETSEIGRLTQVMGLGSTTKELQVQSFASFASPELIRKTRGLCLEEAIQNAIEKADRLAKASGVQRGSLILAQEDTIPVTISERPQVKSMSMEAMPGSASGNMSLEGGETKLVVGVRAQFSIR